MVTEELLIRNGKKWVVVPQTQIKYIVSENKLCKVVTATHEYLLSTPLQVLEADLPGHVFIKVHRSCIVAWSSITAITDSAIYIDKLELPVSRKILMDIKNRYQKKYY